MASFLDTVGGWGSDIAGGFKKGLGNFWDAYSGDIKYKSAPYQIGGSAQEQYDFGRHYSPEETRELVMSDPGAFGAAVGSGEIVINEDGTISRPMRDPQQIHAERQGQSRGEITGLLSDAEAAYRGEGPSLAADILEQGTERAAREQYSMASSAPVTGGSQAALFAQAGQNAATAGQQASREAAMQRSAEQQQAMDTRAQVAPQLYSEDIRRGGLDQDAAMRSQEINAQTARQKASNKQKASGGILTAIGSVFSDIRAKEDVAPIRYESSLTPRERAVEMGMTRSDMAPADAGGGGGGMMEGLGGMMSMLSDEDSKQYIERLEDALGEARGEIAATKRAEYPTPERPPEMDLATAEGSRIGLAPMEPYRYRYKPEAAEAMGTDTGERTGVMAQEMERSPYYRDAVVETPEGKALDGQRLLSANTAATVGLDKRADDIDERLRRLEGMTGSELIGLDRAPARATMMPKTRSPIDLGY